ncbi:hypothetical protein L218DRAFT_945105 [Marasmius fiardii PR-910]|nr:hypothetical protein L218DRAFT_945105 [Marasmius fiardii PR-910]
MDSHQSTTHSDSALPDIFHSRSSSSSSDTGPTPNTSPSHAISTPAPRGERRGYGLAISLPPVVLPPDFTFSTPPWLQAVVKIPRRKKLKPHSKMPAMAWLHPGAYIPPKNSSLVPAHDTEFEEDQARDLDIMKKDEIPTGFGSSAI